MSQDLTLSRRAVAAGWKWQAGALLVRRNSLTQLRVACINGDYADLIAPSGHWAAAPIDNDLPDFNDAATRGVLLQQVRERWGNPYAYTVPVLDRNGLRFWAVWLPQPGGWGEDGQGSFTGPSETAALVAALEAAPKEKNNG